MARTHLCVLFFGVILGCGVVGEKVCFVICEKFERKKKNFEMLKIRQKTPLF